MASTETAASRGDERTSRDELTPLSRASRRRWVLAYALLLVLAAIYFGSGGAGSEQGGGVWLALLASLFVVFGMLRRGTRRLTALDHPGLDERDAGARDRAFRLAYPLLLVVLCVIAVVVVIALPDAQRPVDIGARVTDSQLAWSLTPEALLGIVALVRASRSSTPSRASSRSRTRLSRAGVGGRRPRTSRSPGTPRTPPNAAVSATRPSRRLPTHVRKGTERSKRAPRAPAVPEASPAGVAGGECPGRQRGRHGQHRRRGAHR